MKLWLGLALLAMLAGATTWLLRHYNPAPGTRPAPTGHQPDYYFEGATITQMNTAGKLQYRLLATLITHHPDDDSTDLTAPRLTYLQAHEPPWHVVAERGQVPSGGAVVHLRGNVIVTHPAATGSATLKIFTPTLDVLTAKREAHTDSPVRIVQGPSHVNAVGMTVEMDTSHMELESAVRGIYAH